MNKKLTNDDYQEIIRRKQQHDSLIKQRRFTEARQIGPKVIARDFGINRTTVYKILTTKENVR
jgi:DNA-binding phage protein